MANSVEKTKNVLKSMFVENTGRSFLDSGGTPRYKDGKYVGSEEGYGRAFERNQHIDFDALPDAWLRKSGGYLELTFSSYKWLLERVTFDYNMDRRFKRFAAKPANEDKGWLELMTDFVETNDNFRDPLDKDQVGGRMINTYNEENYLDQTLQFVLFWDRDAYQMYVLLQVHGGADVRGGYTKPRAFSVSGDPHNYSMFDYSSGYVHCDGKPHADFPKCPNGDMHLPWMKQECTPHARLADEQHVWDVERSLTSGEFVDNGDNSIAVQVYKKLGYPRAIGDFPVTSDDNDEVWTPGHIHVRADGKPLCPLCGGVLSASMPIVS